MLILGIYLGFEDEDSSNNKHDKEDVRDGDDLELNTTSCRTETKPKTVSSNIFWNFFKMKRSSKYCVNSQRDKKRNFCYWFVRKICGNP